MYAVVQVRGVVNTRREIKETLKMLRLHHINTVSSSRRRPSTSG